MSYACGSVGHMACDCVICALHIKAQESNSSSNAVALAGKGAAQVFALATIAGQRITNALIDNNSEFSMLSSAMNARLRLASLIETRVAPDVVGVGGASAEIRGYVDAPVKVVDVTVNHPLLVVKSLAFSFIIGT